MSLRLASGVEIGSVLVVDDDPSARQGHSWLVEDLELVPVPVDGDPTLPAAEIYAELVPGLADALVCDHHLRKRNYANFNGAELVAALYKRTPAVLCTRWEEVVLDEIRPLRDRIPVLLRELDEENLLAAFNTCVREFVDGPAPDRVVYRTQAHVQEVSNDAIFIQLPGWTSLHVFRIGLRDLPAEIGSLHVDQRIHVHANLGADDSSEVYFKDWSL